MALDPEKLTGFYVWAFGELDRIDKLKDRWQAQIDLMSVIRRENMCCMHEPLEARIQAQETAKEEIDGNK